jgi:hypothetical protein
MKRIKIVALCLVAVFAITALAAASASAAKPEFVVCKKEKKTGKFTKGCVAAEPAGKGAGERETIAEAGPQAYKDKNGVSTLTVYIPGKGIVGETVCQKAKGAGAIIGEKTTETTVEFEKCESAEKTCTSTNTTKKGEIKTELLEGKLIATGESPTGFAVTVGAKSGGKSAEFNCEGLEISTTGAVSGAQEGNIGKASKKSVNNFTVNGEGEPTIAAGGPLLTTIVGVGTLPSGENTKAALTGKSEVGVF